MNIKATVRHFSLVIALFILLSALSGCDSGTSDGGEGTENTQELAVNAAEKYGYVYHIDTGRYSAMFKSYRKSELKLVNKSHTVDDRYNPGRLTVIDSSLTNGGKEVKMEEIAAVAAEALICEMRECGYTGVSITSGYRSYSYQSSLFSMYIGQELEKHPGWTQAEAEAEVLTYSAKPGTSEHQTGLCMDLYLSRMLDLVNYGYETQADGDIGFAESGEYRWLCENARYFGFILRFPDGKSDITGYGFESWHFRYVGIDNAVAIWERNITLEQYLAG